MQVVPKWFSRAAPFRVMKAVNKYFEDAGGEWILKVVRALAPVLVLQQSQQNSGNGTMCFHTLDFRSIILQHIF